MFTAEDEKLLKDKQEEKVECCADKSEEKTLYITKNSINNKDFYDKCKNASIVGDTVGDPLKDTSGPSINILIKLSSIVSVVFGSFFVKTSYLIDNHLK